MTGQRDWRPACDPMMLRIRAMMRDEIRDLFRERQYLEVETPCLSRDIVLDAWLDPFELMVGSGRWFLQTSPEAFMKRLLAAGSGSIWQFSRVFRSGESGARHNPEFTMLEWYGCDTTWLEQMALTEQLVRRACVAAGRVNGHEVRMHLQPFAAVSYADAFSRRYGIDVMRATGRELMQCARDHGVPLPDSLTDHDINELCNVLLAFGIEPDLGRAGDDGALRPVFLTDYPPSQAALAMISDTDPPVARRFELYVDGLELCNGYQELTDPAELVRRDVVRSSARRESRATFLPGAASLTAAMSAGLPDCSGVALGFDRLVMIAIAAASIQDVLAFPFDRA